MLIADAKNIAREKYKEIMGAEWVEDNAFTIFDRLMTVENDDGKMVYEIYQSVYNGRKSIFSYLKNIKNNTEMSGRLEHKTTFLLDLEEETVTVLETY